jgi:hypothetical protein
MSLNASTRFSLLAGVLAGVTSLAPVPTFAGSSKKFILSSPNIAPGSKIDSKFVLNGFGCRGREYLACAATEKCAGRHQVIRAAIARPGRTHRQRFLALDCL